MASPKMFAEVVIAGSYRNLSKSTRGATKELNIFEKNAKKISGAISAAFAGIALAGFTMLTDAIIDMGKAAAEDRQSMALLNKTLENSWGVTEKTTKAVDDYITSVSYMTGIVDDDLRPAFAKIARVTDNLTDSQKAFDRVMNISAGTGKDVNLVAQAYSKYLGGNKTALDKLVPGLKDAGDKMGFVDEKYKGMAKTAGDNDPFAKINVALGEFQEKIGYALLPIIDKVSKWLTSKEAQKQMDRFAKSIENMFAWFSSPAGQQGMQNFLDKISEIGTAINDMVDGFGQLKPLFDFIDEFTKNRTPNVNSKMGGGWFDQMFGGNSPVSTPTSATKTTGTTINIYGTTSGNDVVKALRQEAGKKGMSLGRMLTIG